MDRILLNLLSLTLFLWTPLATAQAPQSIQEFSHHSEDKAVEKNREAASKHNFGSAHGQLPILQILHVPPDQLEEKLQKWPRYQKMNLEEQQRVKDRIAKARGEMMDRALAKAKDMGLTIPEDKKQQYFQDFVQARSRVEETVRQEMEPRRLELEKLEFDQIKKKYATP